MKWRHVFLCFLSPGQECYRHAMLQRALATAEFCLLNSKSPRYNTAASRNSWKRSLLIACHTTRSRRWVKAALLAIQHRQRFAFWFTSSLGHKGRRLNKQTSRVQLFPAPAGRLLPLQYLRGHREHKWPGYWEGKGQSVQVKVSRCNTSHTLKTKNHHAFIT